MDPDADLASVAALIADKNRAQVLLTLLGGVPQSGSALAEAAGISRSLASAHLKKLVAGGLVQARPNGRQQLYSIASEPVADALEIRLPVEFDIVTAPPPLIDATLKEYARAEPSCGFPRRLKRIRNIASASVAVPTVDRGSAPRRSWSTMIAVVRPPSTSTSGRARLGMNPWTNAL